LFVCLFVCLLVCWLDNNRGAVVGAEAWARRHRLKHPCQANFSIKSITNHQSPITREYGFYRHLVHRKLPSPNLGSADGLESLEVRSQKQLNWLILDPGHPAWADGHDIDDDDDDDDDDADDTRSFASQSQLLHHT
jgi:hypothetical protein